MLDIRSRKWALCLAAAAALGVAVPSFAAVYSDAADGQWNSPDTWGGAGAPSTTDDVINISQYTVTVPGVPGAAGNLTAFTGGQINLSGTGTLIFADGYDTAFVPLHVSMNGGTLNLGNGHSFRAGAAGEVQRLSISGESRIITSTDGASIGDAANPAVLTGSGTLIKEGNGHLTLVGDVSTESDFQGTFDVRGGQLRVDNLGFIRNATIILHDTTLRLTDTSAFAGTTSASIPTVTGLYGSGTVQWLKSSYGRDLAVAAGGAVSPGTDDAPGTITRSTSTNRNELIFRGNDTDGYSRLEMDIFGPNQEDADQIIWLDSANTSNVDFRNADLVVRLFTPAGDLPTTSWVLIEADQFGATTNASNTPPSASEIEFRRVSFVADPGWQNLTISYDYTPESSKVIVTGSYVAVPEPASLGLLAIGALGLLRRRRNA